MTSPLGFKARVGSALFAFCGGECSVYSPRSTSGATLSDTKIIICRACSYYSIVILWLKKTSIDFFLRLAKIH